MSDSTFDAAGTLFVLNGAPVVHYKREPFFSTPRVCDYCHVAFKHKGQYSGHLRKCRPDAPWNGAPTRRYNDCLLRNPTLTGIAMSRVHKARATGKRSRKVPKTVKTSTVHSAPHLRVSVPVNVPVNAHKPPVEQQQKKSLSLPAIVAEKGVPRPRSPKSSEKMVKDTINALLEHSRKCYSLEDLVDLDNNVQYMTTALVRMHATLSEIISRHHTVQQTLTDQLDQYAVAEKPDVDDTTVVHPGAYAVPFSMDIEEDEYDTPM